MRQSFENYRYYLQKIIKAAKQKFHLGQFQECDGDMKKTWKLINELWGKKRVSTKPIFKIENEVVQNRRIIANKFNEYFVSLAMNLNKNVENDYGVIIDALPTFETYLTERCKNSMYIGECSTDEIVKIILGFANGKASDIPVRIIKRATPVLAKILKLLYNNCIAEGDFSILS